MRIASSYTDKVDGDGMTLEEIGRHFGVPRQSVYAILQRAYAKLRRNPQAIAVLRAAAELARAERNRRHTWADDESEVA
jgi:DNA-directed RNA polymerase sigma subunit (sigma70/sigma32)